MSHIRYVHDASYVKAVIFKDPKKSVGRSVGSKISNRGEIINGWSAGIHTHIGRIKCYKLFLLSGKGVKQPNIGHEPILAKKLGCGWRKILDSCLFPFYFGFESKKPS